METDKSSGVFSFDSIKHLYFLEVNGEKKPLTGVTTILSVIAKPALIQWSANQTIEYVKEHLTSLDDLDAVLKEAKVAHRKKKESAGDVGTAVHKAIANWITTNEWIVPEMPMANTMIDNFKKWVAEHSVVFTGSEKSVYSEEYWYAGTYDFTATIDGKNYLADIKTSSGIYGREFFAQCAAYRLAHEEMNGQQNFHGSVIVRLGKDGSFEEKYSYDYKTDREIFLAALTLYRGLQTFNTK